MSSTPPARPILNDQFVEGLVADPHLPMAAKKILGGSSLGEIISGIVEYTAVEGEKIASTPESIPKMENKSERDF